MLYLSCNRLSSLAAFFKVQTSSTRKNNKSTGVNNYSVRIRLLQLAAPIICHSLAYICNISLFISNFPSQWKAWEVVKVTPMYKEGDKSDVSSYLDLFHFYQFFQRFWSV